MKHFTEQDVQLLAEHTSYQGFFRMVTLTLKHRLFAGGWSREIKREVFRRGDAAAALLYDPQSDAIGFIEQFRVGALGSPSGPWCCEVVAGIIDPGESAEQTIRRELAEEAGFTARQLVPICDYLSSPGGCDERIYLYCALGDLRGREGLYGLPGEAEDIRLHVVPAGPVLADLYAAKNGNAATLLALQWLVINRRALIQAADD